MKLACPGAAKQFVRHSGLLPVLLRIRGAGALAIPGLEIGFGNEKLVA
jgi:hypothetical protein